MTTQAHKGRGAITRDAGRFATRAVDFDDAEAARRNAVAPETVLTAMQAGKIISHNQSPDVPFDRSINPYQAHHNRREYRPLPTRRKIDANYASAARAI